MARRPKDTVEKSRSSFLGSGSFDFLPSVFVVAALLLALSQLPVFYQRFSCHFQVQQEEAINVEFGRILLRGDSLYPDITQEGPYIHCSYPPFFPFLESLLMRSTNDPWLPGRTLALVGFLGCGFLLGWVAMMRWKSVTWALFLPLLLWLFPTWALWGSMARMDSLLQFLELSSFFFLWRACEMTGRETGKARTWDLGIAGALAALAILMKPTALTLPLAFGLYVALQRPRWNTWIFFASVLGAPALFLAAAQWKTHGLYWTHTVTWASVGFEWRRFSYFFMTSFLREGGWLAVGVLLTLALRPVSLLLKCRLLFAFLSMASLSREGSAENYYMEFLLYGLLVFGEGWASFERRKGAGSLAAVPVLVMLVGLFSDARSLSLPVPTVEEMRMKQQMLSLYRTGDRHLALDADLPVMAGKKVWYQHSGIIPIVGSGSWDPKPLLEDIREKKFSTMEIYDIPQQYLYPPEVEKEIRKNYHPSVRRFGRIWLLPNG